MTKVNPWIVGFFGVAFVFFVTGTASVHAATTYRYGCANFSLSGTVTCTADIVTFPVADPSLAVDMVNPIPIAGTWYVSYVASGSGQGLVCDTVTCNLEPLYASARTDEPVLMTAGGYLQFASYAGFVGTIQDICLTDAIGGCSGAVVPTTSTDVNSVELGIGLLVFVAFCLLGWYASSTSRD